MRGFARGKDVMFRQHISERLATSIQRKDGIPSIGAIRRKAFVRPEGAGSHSGMA
jgi:hypothetical protein